MPEETKTTVPAKSATPAPAIDRKKQVQIEEQAARKFLTEASSITCDPHALLQDLNKTIKEYQKDDGNKALQKLLVEKMNAAMPIVALDTHYALARATIEELRPFAIDFANQLIAEHECKTPTEKALAESAAAAYVRVLQFTQVMTRQVRDEHCSMILNGFYKVASQELDRANRHFISAIATLKEFKSPSLTVQVKATNAFVAQNQQVNAASPDLSAGNEKKVYETVDPK